MPSSFWAPDIGGVTEGAHLGGQSEMNHFRAF